MQAELVLRGRETGQVYPIGQGMCFFIDNRIHCYVIWGRYHSEDGIEYEAFGIQVENQLGIVRRIPDISTDAAAVSCLAERMNRNRVSIHHIDDVVQDFMAS